MTVSGEYGVCHRGVRQVLAADAGQQAAAQPWIGLECLQLGAGRQMARMKIAGTGQHHLVRERQGAAVQKLGCTPDDLCTISYCTSVPGFRFSDLASGPAAPLYFLPARTEFDILVPAGAETVYCTVSQSELLARMQVLDPARWSQTPDRIRLLVSAGHKVFAAGAARILDGPGGACIPSGGQITDWLAQILSVPPPGDPPRVNRASLGRAMRIAGQARDFVDAQFDADVLPSVVDICAAIGVSERSLQYAFGQYVGMSPLTYLRHCRLNRARLALQTPESAAMTVTETALRYGFAHLGRFSGEYRKLFAESPSQTLETGRRRLGP